MVINHSNLIEKVNQIQNFTDNIIKQHFPDSIDPAVLGMALIRSGIHRIQDSFPPEVVLSFVDECLNSDFQTTEVKIQVVCSQTTDISDPSTGIIDDDGFQIFEFQVPKKGEKISLRPVKSNIPEDSVEHLLSSIAQEVIDS